MVFGGQITFSIPPKIVSAPTIFLRPPVFFFGCFFVFSAPKTKIGFFGGRLRSNFFGAQAEKPRFFFFFSAPPRYGVRRPNNFFAPPQIFFGGFFLFFRRSEKPPFFGAQNQKSSFSAGAEGAKSCILGSPAIRAAGGENCPSLFEGVPGLSWNPSGGSTKASNEGFMKPP